jgi:hypothetical protein
MLPRYNIFVRVHEVLGENNDYEEGWMEAQTTTIAPSQRPLAQCDGNRRRRRPAGGSRNEGKESKVTTTTNDDDDDDDDDRSSSITDHRTLRWCRALDDTTLQCRTKEAKEILECFTNPHRRFLLVAGPSGGTTKNSRW